MNIARGGVWVLLGALLGCIPWSVTGAEAEEPELIARVQPGVVAQRKVEPGWLPVKIVFSYAARTYTALIQINAEAYNRQEKHMARHPRPETLGGWVAMVDDGARSMGPLASALRSAVPSRDKETVARFTLAFVQSLPYRLDVLTTPFDEAWRAPLQTLVEREIDCEDSAILYASLLAAQGIDAGLVLVPGHMMAAVTGNFDGANIEYHGRSYFVAETTGTGWPIGRIAPQYQGAEAALLPVKALSNGLAAPTTARLPGTRPFFGSGHTGSSSGGNGTVLAVVLLGLLMGGVGLAWRFLPTGGAHGGRKPTPMADDYDSFDNGLEDDYGDRHPRDPRRNFKNDSTTDPWDEFH